MSRDLLRRAGTIAFSSFTWSASLSWMAFNAATSVLARPLIGARRCQYYWIQPGLALCVRLGGIKLRVIQHPRFDPARRSVFVQNHVSVMDGHLACGAIPQQFCGIMNRAHFNVPGYGWLMQLTAGIPIDPEKKDNLAQLTAHARDRLARGFSILGFPEAGRTLDGTLSSFKRGVFVMARDCGVPVVPLAVRGMFKVNRKGSRLFHPGREVCVFVGPQFETSGLSDEQLDNLIAELRQMMVNWVQKGQLPPDCPANKSVVPLFPLATHYWKVDQDRPVEAST